MDNQSGQIDYWFNIAVYDLETAKAMLETKRFLYVGFMCHQTIEKALKGLYVSIFRKIPPYTHNLTLLAEETRIYQKISEQQKDFLDTLEPLNIEARYPASTEKISRTLSEEKSKTLLCQTEELLEWIKRQLSK